MSNSVPEGWKEDFIGTYVAGSVAGEWGKEARGDKNDIPVLRATNFTENGAVDYKKLAIRNIDEKKRVKKLLKTGDIVLEKSGGSPTQPVGRVIYFDNEKPFLYSNFTQKISPTNKCVSKYLFYKLYHEYQQGTVLKFQQQTTGIINFQLAEYLLYKTIFPPLPEQKKIAAILTSVDTVIEKTQAQIDKLKDLKTGMMQELLTKGIGHTEFKDSPVGRIPVEWGVVTVLELGNGHKDTVQTGPFGAQLHSKDYVEEGIPLVLIKNIKEDGLDDTDIPKITEKDANRLSRYRLKEGDIVFSRVGRVGSCFLCSKNEEGWVFSGQTLRIRFNNSKVDLTYFNYALRTEEIQKELIGESVGSTRSSINTTILESLSVKLPPIQEQKKIASILQSLDSNIKSRELKLKQLMSVKKALMQDLLTGKVRVKV